MKQTYLIYFLLAVIIVGGLFGKLEYNELNRAREIELKRSGEALKKKDREIRLLLDSLHKQDLAALKAIQEEKIRADRLEDKLYKANDKLKKVVFTRFSNDSARVAALAELYPTIGNP